MSVFYQALAAVEITAVKVALTKGQLDSFEKMIEALKSLANPLLKICFVFFFFSLFVQ